MAQYQIAETVEERDATMAAQGFKARDLRARYAPTDFFGAFQSAVRAARKHGVAYYLWGGNSYGRGVWHVDYRSALAFCPISNPSAEALEIDPDGAVRTLKLKRAPR